MMNKNYISPEASTVSGFSEKLFVLNRIGGNADGAGSKIEWSDKQIDFIINHYSQNHSVKELARLFTTSEQTMRTLLHKLGIKTLLTNEKQKILRPRNSDYFEIIDTPDKAYWLGFLYADGYVSEERHSIRINLQKSDEDHLHKFLKAIEAIKTPTKYSKKVTSEKTYEGAYVCIGDEKMVHDLVNKGCMQNKSFTIQFPTEEIVPEYLLSHFIRGVFDGDGTIMYKVNKISNLKYFSIGIIGTKDLLQGIQKFLGKTNIKLEDRKTHYVFHASGNRSVFNIMSILYKDSNEDIELTRKKEKYDLLVEQRHTIKTYSTLNVQRGGT